MFTGEQRGAIAIIQRFRVFHVNREKEAGEKWMNKGKRKEEICLPTGLVTKKKGEKAGTLLSSTRGFTAVIPRAHPNRPIVSGREAAE